MLNMQLQNKDLIVTLMLSIYKQHTFTSIKQVLNAQILILVMCVFYVISIHCFHYFDFFYCSLFLYNYLFNIAPL